MSNESKESTELISETSASNLLSPDSIQVKNVALVVLTTLAVVFALDWAQSFIITMLLGILLAYALNPLVIQLERIKINRVIGSSVVILVLICSLVFAGYALRSQAQSIISILPEAATKLTSSFTVKSGEPLTNMQKLQIAANRVETATSAVESNIAQPKKPIMHVVVEEPKFKIDNFLWRGSLGIFGFIGEACRRAKGRVVCGTRRRPACS